MKWGNGEAVKRRNLRFTHHALRITPYASRTLHITLHALRITHHGSRIANHACTVLLIMPYSLAYLGHL